jgi:hypothetical protein
MLYANGHRRSSVGKCFSRYPERQKLGGQTCVDRPDKQHWYRISSVPSIGIPLLWSDHVFRARQTPVNAAVIVVPAWLIRVLSHAERDESRLSNKIPRFSSDETSENKGIDCHSLHRTLELHSLNPVFASSTDKNYRVSSVDTHRSPTVETRRSGEHGAFVERVMLVCGARQTRIPSVEE